MVAEPQTEQAEHILVTVAVTAVTQRVMAVAAAVLAVILVMVDEGLTALLVEAQRWLVLAVQVAEADIVAVTAVQALVAVGLEFWVRGVMVLLEVLAVAVGARAVVEAVDATAKVLLFVSAVLMAAEVVKAVATEVAVVIQALVPDEALKALCVLSGPAQAELSHQPTLAIFN